MILYLEYLAQQGLKSNAIRNQVSVLKHFFACFLWPTFALTGKKYNAIEVSSDQFSDVSKSERGNYFDVKKINTESFIIH